MDMAHSLIVQSLPARDFLNELRNLFPPLSRECHFPDDNSSSHARTCCSFFYVFCCTGDSLWYCHTQDRRSLILQEENGEIQVAAVVKARWVSCGLESFFERGGGGGLTGITEAR